MSCQRDEIAACLVAHVAVADDVACVIDEVMHQQIFGLRPGPWLQNG